MWHSYEVKVQTCNWACDACKKSNLPAWSMKHVLKVSDSNGGEHGWGILNSNSDSTPPPPPHTFRKMKLQSLCKCYVSYTKMCIMYCTKHMQQSISRRLVFKPLYSLPFNNLSFNIVWVFKVTPTHNSPFRLFFTQLDQDSIDYFYSKWPYVYCWCTWCCVAVDLVDIY